MGTSTNSKAKVQYALDYAGLSRKIGNKLVENMNELESLTHKAKYAAMDRAYNSFATVSKEFGGLLKATNGTIYENLEELSKNSYTGEAFTASVKKAMDEVADAKGIIYDFNAIVDDRDGEELWTPEIQTQVRGVMASIIQGRKEYILELGEISAKAKDEEWSKVYHEIGRNNEEFTNSWARMFKKMEDALTEIGIDLNTELEDITANAGKTAVEAAATNVNLKGSEL